MPVDRKRAIEISNGTIKEQPIRENAPVISKEASKAIAEASKAFAVVVQMSMGPRFAMELERMYLMGVSEGHRVAIEILDARVKSLEQKLEDCSDERSS